MKLSNNKLQKTVQLIIWPLALVLSALLIYKTNFCDITITWSELITLITVIIWPITVIICFLFFRKKLIEIMGSLASFKAGTDGLELTFQNELDSVEELIGIPKEDSVAQSKSSGGLNMQLASSGTPYQQLMEIRDVLNSKIVQRAKELDIPVNNMSGLLLCEKLKEVGGITIKNARSFKALLELTNKADKSIKQAQVDRIKNIVLNFSIK